MDFNRGTVIVDITAKRLPSMCYSLIQNLSSSLLTDPLCFPVAFSCSIFVQLSVIVVVFEGYRSQSVETFGTQFSMVLNTAC